MSATTTTTTERWPRLSRALILAAFAVLVVARMPEIVIKGRFWAEEARNFFANAWVVSPGRALLTPYGGYLNLVANAATLAARELMPLPLAPYVTITTGLVFQLVPPLLLLAARDAWLGGMRTRVAGVLLLLLVPATDEIWLQSLHCQFELTLGCGIILALEPVRGRAAALRLAVLALAPLCGPGAVVLVPLFLLRAGFEWSRARLIEALTLAAASAVQLGVFVGPFAGRTYVLEPVTLLCVVAIRHVIEPLFGLKVAYMVGRDVRHALAAHRLPLWEMVLPVAVFVPLGVVALRERGAVAARWLLLGAGFTAPAAYYGALGGAAILIGAQSGERYVFVPQALLGLAILALASTARRGVAIGASLLVAWLLVAGALTYVATLKDIRNGPAWRDEVRDWQHDPTHRIRVWPEGWSVTLAPHPG